MSYLSYHHGSYWFQLRVPAPLVAKYRDPTILREMRSIADQLKSFCKKSPIQ